MTEKRYAPRLNTADGLADMSRLWERAPNHTEQENFSRDQAVLTIVHGWRDHPRFGEGLQDFIKETEPASLPEGYTYTALDLYSADSQKYRSPKAPENIGLLKRLDKGVSLFDKRGRSFAKLKPSDEKIYLLSADAYNTLMVINQALVLSRISYSMEQGPSVSFEDMLQQGNIGLSTAIRRFDVSRNFTFSTYATDWIDQSIKRYKSKQARSLSVTSEELDVRYRQLEFIRQDFYEASGREPSYLELATALSQETRKPYSVGMVAELMDFGGTRNLSLDQDISDAPDQETYASIIGGDPNETYTMAITDEITKDESSADQLTDTMVQKMSELMMALDNSPHRLTAGERTVFGLYYGIPLHCLFPGDLRVDQAEADIAAQIGTRHLELGKDGKAAMLGVNFKDYIEIYRDGEAIGNIEITAYIIATKKGLACDSKYEKNIDDMRRCAVVKIKNFLKDKPELEASTFQAQAA